MKTKILSFRDLLVWQKGIEITKKVYILVKQLPKQETFGLISQICRAAVSIPANIAEGRGRSTRKSFAQFLYVVQGSVSELETLLIITSDVYQIDISDILKDVHDEQKMLSGMLSKLKANT